MQSNALQNANAMQYTKCKRKAMQCIAKCKCNAIYKMQTKSNAMQNENAILMVKWKCDARQCKMKMRFNSMQNENAMQCNAK
jgi:hypothetical protein